MTQTLLTIFIPTLMVLVGILLNRGDSSRLDARISSLQNKLDERISSIELKLGERITSIESRLDGRISSSEAKLDGRITGLESRLHADMMQVIGKLGELVRVARLEVEQ